MALNGSLRGAALVDVLQLIAHRGRSGVLRIRDGHREVRLRVSGGNIVGVEARGRPEPERLLNRLVRAGLVEAEQREALLSEQEDREGVAPVGLLLSKKQLIDQERLREVLGVQLRDTVLDLFLWEEGSFEFRRQAVGRLALGPEPVRIEHVLMDGVALRHDWGGIEEGLPGLNQPFEATGDLPPEDLDFMGFDQELPAAPPEAEFDDVDRATMDLVTGVTTLAELNDQAKLDRFQLGRSVAKLLSAGYLSLVDPRVDTLDEEAQVSSAMQERLEALLSGDDPGEAPSVSPSASGDIEPMEDPEEPETNPIGRMPAAIELTDAYEDPEPDPADAANTPEASRSEPSEEISEAQILEATPALAASDPGRSASGPGRSASEPAASVSDPARSPSASSPGRSASGPGRSASEPAASVSDPDRSPSASSPGRSASGPGRSASEPVASVSDPARSPSASSPGRSASGLAASASGGAASPPRAASEPVMRVTGAPAEFLPTEGVSGGLPIGRWALGDAFHAELRGSRDPVVFHRIDPVYLEGPLKQGFDKVVWRFSNLPGRDAARVLQARRDDSGAFIALERTSPEALAPPLEGALLLALGRAGARALGTLHDFMIFHGRLRPESFADRDGRPVLVDIHEAMLSEAAGLSEGPWWRFASPERLDGEPPDAASDIYALGALLFQLVCGVPPYDLADREALRAAQSQAAPDLSALQDAPAPASVKDVIQRCLKLPPGERPYSMHQVNALLSKA